MTNYPTNYSENRRNFLKGSAATAVAIAASQLSPLEAMARTDNRPLPDQIVDHIQNALKVTRYGVSPQTYANVSRAHYQRAVNMARAAANGKEGENGLTYQALEAIALTQEANMYSELASLNIVDPKEPKIHIRRLPDIYKAVKIGSPTRVNNFLKALQNYERIEAIHNIAKKQGKIFPESIYKERLATKGVIVALENVYERMLKTLTWLDAETKGRHSVVIAEKKTEIEGKLENIKRQNTRKVKV